MNKIIFTLCVATFVALVPLRNVAAQVTVPQRISDSLDAALRSGTGTVNVDTVISNVGIFTTLLASDTVNVYDTLTVLNYATFGGKVGYFGATPRGACELAYGTPPSPVLEAPARAVYDSSMQYCLTAFGQITTPP